MIGNKKYYIDQINSSKANKFTEEYHYSGVGFKKAILNLGIFRREDNLLVGVLQWGCSYQDSIRLDRYVKEPVAKEEYLELNRFSMADSEGANSESQAISLGIKWIRKNKPKVRLLVSYAGRKEGNYGYIYQATNWEYLGYFISEGFWTLDGEEKHLVTLWQRYSKYGNDEGMINWLCNTYQDVRKTWTKQFIYILRLDDTLTPASDILPYPKPDNEFPIKTREHIYRQNDEVFNHYMAPKREHVEYYWEPERRLFTRQTLVRRGEVDVNLQPKRKVAVYNAGGYLIRTYNHVSDIDIEGCKIGGIRKALIGTKPYKNKYFKYFLWDDEPEEELEDIPVLCVIDEIPFRSFAEVGRYLGCSRQAVHQGKSRNQKIIKGHEITWIDF